MCSCVAGYMKNGTRCIAINCKFEINFLLFDLQINMFGTIVDPKNEAASVVYLTQNELARITLTGEAWKGNSVFKVKTFTK